MLRSVARTAFFLTEFHDMLQGLTGNWSGTAVVARLLHLSREAAEGRELLARTLTSHHKKIVERKKHRVLLTGFGPYMYNGKSVSDPTRTLLRDLMRARDWARLGRPEWGRDQDAPEQYDETRLQWFLDHVEPYDLVLPVPGNETSSVELARSAVDGLVAAVSRVAGEPSDPALLRRYISRSRRPKSDTDLLTGIEFDYSRSALPTEAVPLAIHFGAMKGRHDRLFDEAVPRLNDYTVTFVETAQNRFSSNWGDKAKNTSQLAENYSLIDATKSDSFLLPSAFDFTTVKMGLSERTGERVFAVDVPTLANDTGIANYLYYKSLQKSRKTALVYLPVGGFGGSLTKQTRNYFLDIIYELVQWASEEIKFDEKPAGQRPLLRLGRDARSAGVEPQELLASCC